MLIDAIKGTSMNIEQRIITLLKVLKLVEVNTNTHKTLLQSVVIKMLEEYSNYSSQKIVIPIELAGAGEACRVSVSNLSKTIILNNEIYDILHTCSDLLETDLDTVKKAFLTVVEHSPKMLIECAREFYKLLSRGCTLNEAIKIMVDTPAYQPNTQNVGKGGVSNQVSVNSSSIGIPKNCGKGGAG